MQGFSTHKLVTKDSKNNNLPRNLWQIIYFSIYKLPKTEKKREKIVQFAMPTVGGATVPPKVECCKNDVCNMCYPYNNQ